jgi:hypothetical protein
MCVKLRRPLPRALHPPPRRAPPRRPSSAPSTAWSYVALTSRSTDKATADEAAKLAARTRDWQFEIPNYKYDGMFKPLEELLKPQDTKK